MKPASCSSAFEHSKPMCSLMISFTKGLSNGVLRCMRVCNVLAQQSGHHEAIPYNALA